jgi:Putative phage abortive infection protein
MKPSIFKTLLIISSAFFTVTVVLFCWKLGKRFDTNFPIDSSRFSEFGGFIGGIFGFINFILLIYVFKDSRDQSFNTFFFNALQVHDSVVAQLQTNRDSILALNVDYKKSFGDSLCKNLTDGDLRNECNSYQTMDDGTDYFETLYAILHVRYKYKNESLEMFFKDYHWRIGHYLRSFVALLELIDESKFADTNRMFSARMFQARCSSDEIRLVTYYIMSRNEPERIKLAKLFFKLGFYSAIEDPFIKDFNDRKYFESLVTV